MANFAMDFEELMAGVVRGQENSSLSKVDHCAEDSVMLLDNCSVSPLQQEMSNLVNFDNQPMTYTFDCGANLPRAEIPGSSSDSNLLLCNLNVEYMKFADEITTFPTDSVCYLEALPIEDEARNNLNKTECIDLASISQLESETCHNIEDFAMESFSCATNAHVLASDSEPSSKGQDSGENNFYQNPEGGSNCCGSETSSTLKSPHEKYMEMRRKNNISSRRSRQKWKEKKERLALRFTELEKENKVLRCTVEKLEKQRDALQIYLMKTFKNLP